MKESNEIRTVFRTLEFDKFYQSLSEKIQNKYDYVLAILAEQYVISEKFVKKIETTELYEVRISIGTNEYRTMLFAVDSESFIQSKQVLLLNSFLKKDTKQYRKEILVAQEILKRYTI